MSRPCFTALATCILVVAAAAPQASAGRHPHDRNGFMIGFGIGGGSAGIEDGDGREGSVTGNFRIGYALRPDLVLHYEGSAWTKTDEGATQDVTWTFSTNVAAVTYYPPSSGLFVRGGVGFGTAAVEVEQGGLSLNYDETGFGLLAAGGWEFRLTRKFALAPQVEFTHMVLDDLGSANVIAGGLGFNWYW
jgi:hypothetical protein